MTEAAEAASLGPREGLSLEGFRKVAFMPASGRFVMVVNPKAACSSFKHSVWKAEFDHGLTPFEPPPRSGGAIHRRVDNPIAHLDLGRFAAAPRAVPVYAVVRNPYTRLLSAYMDKIAGDKKEKRRLLLGLGYTFNRPISFDAFVEHVAATASSDMDMHWAPQTHLMQSRHLAYDAIGAVEDLAAFLEPLLARHYGVTGGMSTYRPHSTGASALLDRYYTPRTLKLVRDRYADDFALLGYPDDPARAGEPPRLPADIRPGAAEAQAFAAALGAWDTLRAGGGPLIGRRRLAEARRVLAAAPRTDAGLLLLEAHLALALGAAREAEDLVRRALAQGVDGGDVRIALSRSLARQGRWAEAMAEAQAALAAAGLDRHALLAAAEAARGAGATGEALRYEALADLGPRIDLPRLRPRRAAARSGG